MTVLACALFIATSAAGSPLPLPTTIENFYLRGTQPNTLDPGSLLISSGDECAGCHTNGDLESPIPAEWQGSLMANAARDPVFYACLDIAEHDAPGSGDTCIRCHVPKAWLEGRSTPTDGSMINRQDRDGITCHFCHRMVDPFDDLDEAPYADVFILLDLGIDRPIQSMDLGLPPNPGYGGNASYVIDPYDRRRGPFPTLFGQPGYVPCDDFHFATTFSKCEDELGDPWGCPTFESPFHRRSEMCATCHDVSFPHMMRDVQGNLVFNGPGVPHPTGDKYEMIAEQRTYSEWLKSDFAVGDGVDMGGRFGGPGQFFVSDCQDCHMSAHFVQGCAFVAPRPDIPRHSFNGAATWVLDAISHHYGPAGPLAGFPSPDPINGPDFTEHEAGLLTQNADGNAEFMTLAADLEAAVEMPPQPGPGAPEQLRVRVINQTGHKLPTGYFEGRRMWLTVEFFDCEEPNVPFAVAGAYDPQTGVLDDATTKVYRAKAGPDETLAATVELPPAPSMHSVLGNKMYFDNRIPPRGFTNASFAAIQAQPVGYTYADGQYWDDTWYDIPVGAAGARITLYYQQTTREYIEFLRENSPNADDPSNRGELAYALWSAFGGALPVTMAVIGDEALFPLGEDCNPLLGPGGIATFIDVLLGREADPDLIRHADVNGRDGVNGEDIQEFVDLLLSN